MQSKICSETAAKTMPENWESEETSGRHTPRPGASAENAEAFPSPESSAAPEAPCPADEGTLDGVPASELVLNGFPFLKAGERPFSQRGRLVVSNVPQGASEDDLRRFFIKFGRLAEASVDSDKKEGVVRLETSALAEIARTELDGACWGLPALPNPSTPPPQPDPSADPTTTGADAASNGECSPAKLADSGDGDNVIVAGAAAAAAAIQLEAADAAQAEAAPETPEADAAEAAGSDGPADGEAGDAAGEEGEAGIAESTNEEVEEDATVEGADSETEDAAPLNEGNGEADRGEEEEVKEAAEPQGPRVRVRRARHSAALSVGNLSPCVSNELLAEAFGRFGEVERSIVAVEASGSASGGSRASGRGRLEFTSAEEASRAAEACRNGVFLLTACLRPVMVEPFKQLDEEEGVPEASLPRTLHYYKERSKAPRFATPGTLEFEFAARCRALDEMERLHVQQVERGVQRARERLEAEMETAYHDRVRRREEMRRLDEERRRHMDAQRAAYSSDAQHPVADKRPGTELETEGANPYSSPLPYKSESAHSTRTTPISAQTQHTAVQQHTQHSQYTQQTQLAQHAAQQHTTQHTTQHREYSEQPQSQHLQHPQHPQHTQHQQHTQHSQHPDRSVQDSQAERISRSMHGARAAHAEQHAARTAQQHAEQRAAQHGAQQGAQHGEQHLEPAQQHSTQQAQHAQHAQHAEPHRSDMELPLSSTHQQRSDLGQLLLMAPEQRRLHGGHGGHVGAVGVGDDRLWAGIPESMALGCGCRRALSLSDGAASRSSPGIGAMEDRCIPSHSAWLGPLQFLKRARSTTLRVCVRVQGGRRVAQLVILESICAEVRVLPLPPNACVDGLSAGVGAKLSRDAIRGPMRPMQQQQQDPT